MSYANILVAVDGSEYSRGAVEHALGLAKLCGAKLVILNCRRPLPQSLGEPYLTMILENQQKNAEILLGKLRPMWEGAGVPVEEKVIGGSPAHVIVDVATMEKMDLIVMGSKGKSDLEGLVVGSVAHKVLHLAPCPVLVVKG